MLGGRGLVSRGRSINGSQILVLLMRCTSMAHGQVLAIGVDVGQTVEESVEALKFS